MLYAKSLSQHAHCHAMIMLTHDATGMMFTINTFGKHHIVVNCFSMLTMAIRRRIYNFCHLGTRNVCTKLNGNPIYLIDVE